MTVLNIKLKVSKEILEKSYIRLNSGKFQIVEDTSLSRCLKNIKY
jgi:hypothetical protein